MSILIAPFSKVSFPSIDITRINSITKIAIFVYFLYISHTPTHTNPKTKGGTTMQKYLCEPCGYVYDPELGDPDSGIAPGTAFEDIPEDWVCPICGLGKDVFVPVE